MPAADVARNDKRIDVFAMDASGRNFVHHGQVILFLAPHMRPINAQEALR